MARSYNGNSNNNFKQASKTSRWYWFDEWESWKMYGYGGNDTLIGGEKNDTLDGGTGYDYLEGRRGSDTYYVDSYGDRVIEYAGEGYDHVISTLYSTSLGVNVEKLTLSGSARNGYGNSLNNSIIGNAYSNRIEAQGGNDTVKAGSGFDTVFGGSGVDWLYGEAGNDSLYGGNNQDFIFGGDDYDYLSGSSGDDNLWGGDQNDLLVGGSGQDYLYGENHHDELLGGTGNDYLDGGSGNDLLSGTHGYVDNDFDELRGGSGYDKFVLGNKYVGYYQGDGSNGYAHILDFVGSQDKIVLHGSSDYYVLGQDSDGGRRIYRDFDGSGTVSSGDDLIAQVWGSNKYYLNYLGTTAESLAYEFVA